MGWFKTFLTHHLPWVIIVLALVVGFYAWRGEHDARLQAEAKVKADESQVAVLQQSIIQNNQQIVALQQQMEARDAAAAKQIQTLASVSYYELGTSAQMAFDGVQIGTEVS